MIKKILARLCDICPLCRFARRYPDSWFGKLMIWHGKWCPVWKAWEDVYNRAKG